MGVLIACVGWLLLSAALLHPSALSVPLIERVERIMGAHSSCASTSDCIYLTGTPAP